MVVLNEYTGAEIEVEPIAETCMVQYPLLGVLGMTGTDKLRLKQRIKLTQFPFNVCNATTCHKLQGMTNECLVINSFRYTDNWPYVVLSRVTQRDGIFLRVQLDGRKVKGMSDELTAFMQDWRQGKSPFKPTDNDYDRHYTK
jgi:hypothetical protein